MRDVHSPVPWFVRAPWPDEVLRANKHFPNRPFSGSTSRIWHWVGVAGQEARIVGAVRLSEPESRLGAPAQLEILVRPAWILHPVTESLLHAALTKAEELRLPDVEVQIDSSAPMAGNLEKMGFQAQPNRPGGEVIYRWRKPTTIPTQA